MTTEDRHSIKGPPLPSREELAIISNIGFGMRDANYPVIYFEVSALSGGALQIITTPESIDKFIRTAGCYNITDLNGKACIVERTGNTMLFVRMHK